MSEVARELYRAVQSGSEGGTVALDGLPLPVTGFYVGGAIKELVLDHDDFTACRTHVVNELIMFVSRASTPYVGHWTDSETGKIHFDAVNWFQDEYTAAAIGRVRKEIAIWDVRNERELRLAYVDGE